MSTDAFVAQTAVRNILQGLEDRVAHRVQGKARWDESVRTILPSAQRFYELLAPAVAALLSEKDRQQLIEGAWKEFRKRAIALSPPKEQVSSRARVELNADWTWVAFDNRGKAIRVDRITGQPTEASQKAIKAVGWGDWDLNELGRVRTTTSARKRRQQRRTERSAGQNAGHSGRTEPE